MDHGFHTHPIGTANGHTHDPFVDPRVILDRLDRLEVLLGQLLERMELPGEAGQ